MCKKENNCKYIEIGDIICFLRKSKGRLIFCKIWPFEHAWTDGSRGQSAENFLNDIKPSVPF